jgi:hypothetical protein
MSSHLSGPILVGGTQLASVSLVNQMAVTAHLADAGTAGSAYVVAPHAGTLSSISVVNYAANATTQTIYTVSINAGAVTHPALATTITAAAGTAVTVVPTAANTVAAGDVLKITSDGGSSSVMPIMATFLITRS